jgi:hypothetical protein
MGIDREHIKAMAAGWDSWARSAAYFLDHNPNANARTRNAATEAVIVCKARAQLAWKYVDRTEMSISEKGT